VIKRGSSMPGLPNLSRVVGLAAILALAAIALFFLPGLFGVGGRSGGSSGVATPGPSASVAPATASPAPTPVPAPTAQQYTIKQGDTLSKVAKRFGLTLDQLLAANTETIKNADKIAIGDVINIPAPNSDEVTGASLRPPAEPTASP